jgi:hypothetical protein
VGPRCEGRVPRVCPIGSLSQPVCLRGGGSQFWELHRDGRFGLEAIVGVGFVNA